MTKEGKRFTIDYYSKFIELAELELYQMDINGRETKDSIGSGFIIRHTG